MPHRPLDAARAPVVPSVVAPDAPRPGPDRPSLPSLTGLRWVAAFVVFGYHVRNTSYFRGPAQDAMTHVFGAGATGVSLFFLLSGFVLAWSDRPDRGPVAFWRRRIARVYPLHVATLGLALVAGATVLPGIRSDGIRPVLANLLLVSSWKGEWWQAGNPVSWSLVCEAFFYLLFPLIMPVMRRMGTVALAITAGTMAWFAFIGPLTAVAVRSPLSAYSSPVMRLPEFLLGVVLAVLMTTGAWRGPRLLPAVLVTAAGYVTALTRPESVLSWQGFTVAGFALLVPALARADVSGRRTALASRPMVALGVLSFPFYLVHLLVVQALAAGFPGGAPALTAGRGATLTATALALALVIAKLLHDLVEVPGRRLILSRRAWPSGKGGMRPRVRRRRSASS